MGDEHTDLYETGHDKYCSGTIKVAMGTIKKMITSVWGWNPVCVIKLLPNEFEELGRISRDGRGMKGILCRGNGFVKAKK